MPPLHASLTHVDLLLQPALLAPDLAAPDHLAVARLLHAPVLHVVAPAAADGVAAARLAAHAAPRAGRVAAAAAEAGRLLHVGQLTLPELGEVGVHCAVLTPGRQPLAQLRPARGLVGAGEGLLGLLVLALEQVAHGVEGGQLQPARLHRARARHAVTLARGVDLVLHHLPDRDARDWVLFLLCSEFCFVLRFVCSLLCSVLLCVVLFCCCCSCLFYLFVRWLVGSFVCSLLCLLVYLLMFCLFI